MILKIISAFITHISHWFLYAVLSISISQRWPTNKNLLKVSEVIWIVDRKLSGRRISELINANKFAYIHLDSKHHLI